MKAYEEQYVTFETAKLLDKAGFNYKCRQFYLHDGGRWPYTHQTVLPQNEPACHAPTQQQAMRWLREEYGLHVSPEHKAFYQERPKKTYHHWCPAVIVLPSRHPGWGVVRPHGADSDDFYYHGYKAYHDTYEDACEEAIKYAIKEMLKP